MTGPRRRDADRTKTELLEAATLLFSMSEYEPVSVRRIAAATGVDAALAFRYFGSKQGLFEAALVAAFKRVDWFDGDRSTFGKRVAKLATRASENDLERASLLMVLRASSHPDTSAPARQAIIDSVLSPMALWLRGDGGPDRAMILSSLIIGAATLSVLLGPDGFSVRQEALLASSIQNLVDDV